MPLKKQPLKTDNRFTLRRPLIAWAPCLGGLVISVWVAGNGLAQQQPRLVHRWETEPDLGATWLYIPAKPKKTLEPERLNSEQRQLRVAESQEAIRYANDSSLSGRDVGLQSIIAQLKKTDENQLVQLSLVSAALKLSDGSHAAELWDILRTHAASRKLLEPALVAWRSPVALEYWRELLTNSDTPVSELLIAVEGIGAAGNGSDRERLEILLRSDRTPTPLKIVIARALGAIVPVGLESLAEQVTAAQIAQHELIAAELLRRHTSDRAREQLVDILNSNNIAARVIAYAAIAENFSMLARELAAAMIGQADNNIRRQAIEVLDRFDDGDSLRVQATAIGDRNHVLRNLVRENLEKKASRVELKPIVDEAITTQLNGESARAIVQAILLSVALEERQRCPRLVALLEHPDMDVCITAAWALQSLADSTEVLDAIFKNAERLTKRLQQDDFVTLEELFRQAYLFEALGRNRYRPALDLLKIYIPKNGHKMGDFARAAAIWAVGKIEEGSQDSALAKQLAQRMLDQSVNDPEDTLVQFTSTVALGWIKDPSSVDDLRKVAESPPAPMGLARDWSLKQLSQP